MGCPAFLISDLLENYSNTSLCKQNPQAIYFSKIFILENLFIRNYFFEKLPESNKQMFMKTQSRY